MQKGSITSSRRKNPSNLHKRAFAKYNPVECAVNNVTYSPCKDKGNTEYQSVTDFVPGHLIEPPSDDDHSHDAEKTQEQFTKIAAQFHSEGHSFIFSKMDDKPMTGYYNILTKGHVCFYPKFQYLIKNYDQDDDD